MKRSIWRNILFSTLFGLLFIRIVLGAVRTDLEGFIVLALPLALPYIILFFAVVLYGHKPKHNKYSAWSLYRLW